ncbi:MAG TPA: 4-hydroxythreonine-4-phosphate dehydrogenase PdxA [Pseudolabrys sp.]|jgi:4-hydroxythreonine-4-phosphate dehydrogenase|nr:4-hydroxythreonine-4-phosphate dehydrogenase PdxA [Pseudolabrys sp.]
MTKPRIAIATGDPAGIGPEISLKAALDPAVRAACRPLLVGDPTIIARHAKACGMAGVLDVFDRIENAEGRDGRAAVFACSSAEAGDIKMGGNSAAAGRASLAAARAAIQAALAGEVDAVVAAPQNQTSIAMAGVEFDGYPSFVARETNLERSDVYLMLCFDKVKIVHCTLHVSVSQAIASITRERVGHVISVTDRTLRRFGIAEPKIYVSGLNPHAGEGGLFGSEDAEIIKPAIDAAARDGIRVAGPFGADTMFHKADGDAFIVMLHDQGHIVAKLLARNATAGLAIGSPILFSSVAHGSGHDIVGKGLADPKAMIEAISRLARAGRVQRPA